MASVFVQALFFTMLKPNAWYKETKCSHTDKLQTTGHKKATEKRGGKKKKKQDMSTGKA